MSASTLQFISQVKLGELRRQRSLLLAAYDGLAQDSAARASVEGLKCLFDGLQNIKLAGKPLHPDLGNLDLLMRGTAPSEEIVAFWRKRLSSEVQAGRLRADIVYLFGALLGEWGDEDAAKRAFLDERRQTHQSLLEQVVTPTVESNPGGPALLSELFAGLEGQLSVARAKIATAMAKAVESGNNVSVNLAAITENIYQPPDIRQEAKRFLDNPVLHRELQDALRVVTRDLHDWTWPAEGVASRALWTRNKWRLYLNLSLVQLCVLHSFGDFWTSAVEKGFGDAPSKITRLVRYHKLLDLNAPDVILENERRMLRQEEDRVDLGWYESTDPWDGLSLYPADKFVPCIVTRRAEEQAALRDSRRGGYYGGYGVNRLVSLVHAEVRTLRASFPERPLFLGKLDVRDYFASLPHEILITMLQGLGLPDRGLDGVLRFLAVPYLVDGRVVPARRGVPLDQPLSHWLAEWLLRLMERYVQGHARVRIIRQIDDICLLSPSAEDLIAAWQAVLRFLDACGLAVNDEKSGACALGAERPRALPEARPRWGLLELTEEGDWRVHEPTFQTYGADTRKQVTAKHAILAQVTLYNAHLRFLTSAVGLALDLGVGHRQSVNQALRRFDADFFGTGVSIVAGLHDTIRARYLEGAQLGQLPEGWMHWPVTAGGLGLRSAFVIGGQYQQAFEERKPKRVAVPPGRPDNWQHGDAPWTAFYDDQLKNLEPGRPKETKVMKALVDDFIVRGQEISGGKQQGLSDYWRWVLSIYGPEILDRFGTFRFLLTDLVPLQLIHEQLLHDSSLEG